MTGALLLGLDLMMTELEFKSLAALGYNRIPLISEAFADLETPLSLYLKLCSGAGAYGGKGGRNSFLLESVVGGERFGRYSYIGLPARTVLQSRGLLTEVIRDGQVVETHAGNPLDFIAAYQQRFKVALRPGMPRFCGGLAGYFGYDAVRYIEPKLARFGKDAEMPGGIDTPDVMLLQCEELAVIDNLSGKLYLIVYADPSQPEAFFKAQKRLTELRDKLAYSVSAPVVKRGQAHPVEREFAKADYLAAVLRAKEYIAAGDMMQVQIGQRLRKRYTESPLSLYRALRSLNPSPYMYFYDMGEFQIVGASPEILVRQEHSPDGDKVTIRPLAGTRPARRHTRARPGPGARAEGRSQGVGRASDADRPGPQRHRPHRQDRLGQGDGCVCGRALLACDAFGQQCRRHLERRRQQSGRVPRQLPGRHAERRAEDPRDADH